MSEPPEQDPPAAQPDPSAPSGRDWRAPVTLKTFVIGLAAACVISIGATFGITAIINHNATTWTSSDGHFEFSSGDLHKALSAMKRTGEGDCFLTGYRAPYPARDGGKVVVLTGYGFCRLTPKDPDPRIYEVYDRGTGKVYTKKTMNGSIDDSDYVAPYDIGFYRP